MDVFKDFSSLTSQKKLNNSQNNSATTSGIMSKKQKKDIIDIISEKTISDREVNDCVTMPKAIFKGYLCFTAGTALSSISSMFKENKYAKYLNVFASLISVYGTYNFVKPFLYKDKSQETKVPEKTLENKK